MSWLPISHIRRMNLAPRQALMLAPLLRGGVELAYPLAVPVALVVAFLGWGSLAGRALRSVE